MKQIKLAGDIKLKELEAKIRKLRKKGLKPFIKGKGSGSIKLGFE